MAALSTLRTRVGYNVGYTPGTATPATSTMIDQFINDAEQQLMDRFYERKCFHLLTALQKEAEYTLTGTEEYDLYTVLGSSTDYYGFVNAQIGDFPVREVTVDEYHKIVEGGEYYPTTSEPFICFYEYDSATGHGNLPKIRIQPDDLTETLYFRYFKKLTGMSSDSDTPQLPIACDDALVWFATAMCWMRDRQQQMYAIAWANFQQELNDLIAKYEQPMFYDINYHPVT